MKVYVSKDEIYPAYCIEEDPKYARDDWNDPIELNEAEIAEFKMVCEAYDAWREKISRLIDEYDEP